MTELQIDYFKKAIDKLPGKLIFKTDILNTSAGQKYFLAINKKVFYELRLFVEKDERLKYLEFFVDPRRSGIVPKVLDYLLIADISTYLNPLWVHRFSDFYDEESAKEKLGTIVTNLSWDPIKLTECDLSNNAFLNGKFYKINIIQKPINPDFYFRPGDHIQISKELFNRSCIYMGNSKVVYVSHASGDHEKMEVSIVEENWSKFSYGYNQMFVFIPNVRVMTNEQITQMAHELVGDREGKSNNVDNLVQHFGTLCHLGYDRFSSLNNNQMKFRNDLFKSIILSD